MLPPAPAGPHSPEAWCTDGPLPSCGIQGAAASSAQKRQQANGQVTSGLRTAPGLARGLGSKIQENKTLRPLQG